MRKKITAGRDLLGNIAPKFAELNDDILFGEVWAREDKLSARDRSLITVTGLMASGILDSSLKFHLKNFLKFSPVKIIILKILFFPQKVFLLHLLHLNQQENYYFYQI